MNLKVSSLKRALRKIAALLTPIHQLWQLWSSSANSSSVGQLPTAPHSQTVARRQSPAVSPQHMPWRVSGCRCNSRGLKEGVFVKDQGVDSIPTQKVKMVQPKNGTIPGSLEMKITELGNPRKPFIVGWNDPFVKNWRSVSPGDFNHFSPETKTPQGILVQDTLYRKVTWNLSTCWNFPLLFLFVV